MGGGGCCSCGCCTREVEREFYTHTILSADQTIKHWEAAVEAGRNILWDALSDAMGAIASNVIDEYGRSLEKTERIIVSALDDQFNVIKSGRESVVAEAKKVQKAIREESEGFSKLQRDIVKSAESPKAPARHG